MAKLFAAVAYVSGTIAAGSLLQAAIQDQQRVFRDRIDVIRLDVSVLGDEGVGFRSLRRTRQCGLQLVSQTVVERTREFGVRLVIGATRGHVMGLVFRVVTLIGAPVGLAVSYFASRLVESRLYGVAPADPVVYATAIASLLAVVFLASLIPARTASRANPVDVLRAE